MKWHSIFVYLTCLRHRATLKSPYNSSCSEQPDLHPHIIGLFHRARSQYILILRTCQASVHKENDNVLSMFLCPTFFVFHFGEKLNIEVKRCAQAADCSNTP